MIEAVPTAWDRVRDRPIGDLTELRGRLDYLGADWNGYYRELMDLYAAALADVIADIDRYLDSDS